MYGSIKEKRAIETAVSIIEKAGFVVIRKPLKSGVELTIIPKASRDKETPYQYPNHNDDSYSVIE
jgi:hypothetical protein